MDSEKDWDVLNLKCCRQGRQEAQVRWVKWPRSNQDMGNKGGNNTKTLVIHCWNISKFQSKHEEIGCGFASAISQDRGLLVTAQPSDKVSGRWNKIRLRKCWSDLFRHLSHPSQLSKGLCYWEVGSHCSVVQGLVFRKRGTKILLNVFSKFVGADRQIGPGRQMQSNCVSVESQALKSKPAIFANLKWLLILKSEHKSSYSTLLHQHNISRNRLLYSNVLLQSQVVPQCEIAG